MIPPPAQPAPFWDYHTSGKRLLAPANQQAGQGCTQFGITRRPYAHRSATSGAAQPAMGAIRISHIGGSRVFGQSGLDKGAGFLTVSALSRREAGISA